jgi:hypothetical protein
MERTTGVLGNVRGRNMEQVWFSRPSESSLGTNERFNEIAIDQSETK